jgi:hypothetical protein
VVAPACVRGRSATRHVQSGPEARMNTRQSVRFLIRGSPGSAGLRPWNRCDCNIGPNRSDIDTTLPGAGPSRIPVGRSAARPAARPPKGSVAGGLRVFSLAPRVVWVHNGASLRNATTTNEGGLSPAYARAARTRSLLMDYPGADTTELAGPPRLNTPISARALLTPEPLVRASAATAARSSPWRKCIVAPRPTMRPDARARNARISGIFERRATPRGRGPRRGSRVGVAGGMQRRSNADGLAPRVATCRTRQSGRAWTER